MLERTKEKLHRLYNNDPMIGTDGQLHQMDGVTQINSRQTDSLSALHRSIKPDLSIETGLAYGFSSLPMLDAMAEDGYGHHIAIDPLQTIRWHGIALAAIEELGFSDRFTWLEDRSDHALPKMIEEKKRAQFIFFDGAHYFDSVLADLLLADQILDVGGMLVINDMWMPAIRAISSFIETNLTHLAPQVADHENIFVVKKTRPDARAWDHFVPFNSAGRMDERPAGLFGKLFGGRT